MFGHGVLESVPPDRREAFLRTVEEAARPDLYRDGKWVTEYHQLVVAVRP